VTTKVCKIATLAFTARDPRNGRDYAFEELVAELAAAFLCAELEIPGRPQHPEYIANWAAVLRADNKAIWTAGARATEAVHFLHKAAGFAEPEQDAA
jgi:antirestriction protein ArdC